MANGHHRAVESIMVIMTQPETATINRPGDLAGNLLLVSGFVSWNSALKKQAWRKNRVNRKTLDPVPKGL